MTQCLKTSANQQFQNLPEPGFEIENCEHPKNIQKQHLKHAKVSPSKNLSKWEPIMP